jgi:hypothetical protein
MELDTFQGRVSHQKKSTGLQPGGLESQRDDLKIAR